MVANLFRFIPQEERFFDLLSRSAGNVRVGAQLLRDFLENFTDVDRKARRLKDIEHDGDEITHEIFRALNRTFVTPIDREDIAELAEALDDALDWIEEVSRRMVIYKISAPTELALRFARIIDEQAAVIDGIVPLIANLKNRAEIDKGSIEVHRLENEADDLLVDALGGLYVNAETVRDLAYDIRWADLYQLMEAATDKAAQVCNVLQNIVVKNA